MLKIIDKENCNYIICYSKDADRCIRYAAEELAKYLYLACNTSIPIHSDKCQKRTKEISIGATRGKTYNKDFLKKSSSDAFCIFEDGDDLVFLGNSSRAILYAVYRFLEDYIGFRCYASDEIDYETKDHLYFVKDIEYDFRFEYREVYFRDAFDAGFASKNMLNSNMADLSEMYGGKMKWYNFHHSFSDLLNVSDYYDEHPEYFSFVDGIRRKEHTELCLSNEEVYNICLNKLKTWIKDNSECQVFSVAQDEWMGHFIPLACECPKCKALDEKEESQSASIINFVNRLSEEVKKEYPDKLIHTFAYQYSRKPPKTLKPADNVIVRLCNIECSWNEGIEESLKKGNKQNEAFYDDLLKWSKITKRLYLWDYAVNFRNYLLPFPNLTSMVKNIETYKKLGVKGLLMQGNFSFGGRGYLDELKAYLASRFMRYDNLLMEEEIKDFLNHYYGRFACIAYDYIMLWEDHIKNYQLWLYDDSDAAYFDDEILSKALKVMDAASSIDSSDDKYNKRFKALKLSLDYLVLTRLGLNNPTREEKLDALVEEIKNQKITEIFERTALDYSIEVLKKSQYAKERPNWVSLYYIMK